MRPGSLSLSAPMIAGLATEAMGCFANHELEKLEKQKPLANHV
jgi:hypothetical protein